MFILLAAWHAVMIIYFTTSHIKSTLCCYSLYRKGMVHTKCGMIGEYIRLGKNNDLFNPRSHKSPPSSQCIACAIVTQADKESPERPILKNRLLNYLLSINTLEGERI